MRATFNYAMIRLGTLFCMVQYCQNISYQFKISELGFATLISFILQCLETEIPLNLNMYLTDRWVSCICLFSVKKINRIFLKVPV